MSNNYTNGQYVASVLYVEELLQNVEKACEAIRGKTDIFKVNDN
jgi:hypothetical protein